MHHLTGSNGYPHQMTNSLPSANQQPTIDQPTTSWRLANLRDKLGASCSCPANGQQALPRQGAIATYLLHILGAIVTLATMEVISL